MSVFSKEMQDKLSEFLQWSTKTLHGRQSAAYCHSKSFHRSLELGKLSKRYPVYQKVSVSKETVVSLLA